MHKSIYLECVNNRSNKFYELELDNSKVIVNYGRINKAGKELNKIFTSTSEASNFYEKQLNTKLKKYSIAHKKYSIDNKKFQQLKFNF